MSSDLLHKGHDFVKQVACAVVLELYNEYLDDISFLEREIKKKKPNKLKMYYKREDLFSIEKEMIVWVNQFDVKVDVPTIIKRLESLGGSKWKKYKLVV